MYYRFKYYFFLAFLGVTCSPKEAMYQQNASFNYAPETAVNHELRAEGDSLHVYLKFADENLFKNTSSPQLQYLFNLSYERSEIIKRDTVPVFKNKIKFYPDFAIADFKLKVPQNPSPTVLQLKIFPHKNDEEVLWVDIPLTKESLNRPFILTDSSGIPLFRNHVNLTETFWISAIDNSHGVQLKKYEGVFPGAAPPFSRLTKNVPAELTMSRSDEVMPNKPVKLAEAGLYLLTMGNASMSVVAEGNLYPELTTADELIEPLLYITSAKERNELYAASQPKLALDQFWLTVANQDKNLARQLIKTYYGRVKEANQFFNSHKAGWLTDRGMIYIIFGKPASVNRKQYVEEWTYSGVRTRGGLLKFIFVKKPNNFTQNHYELVRRPDYEFVWYSTVEKWRKGIIQEE